LTEKIEKTGINRANNSRDFFFVVIYNEKHMLF